MAPDFAELSPLIPTIAADLRDGVLWADDLWISHSGS